MTFNSHNESDRFLWVRSFSTPYRSPYEDVWSSRYRCLKLAIPRTLVWQLCIDFGDESISLFNMILVFIISITEFLYFMFPNYGILSLDVTTSCMNHSEYITVFTRNILQYVTSMISGFRQEYHDIIFISF